LAFHQHRLTAKMLRQLKAIEQTTGFLRAVSLRPDWMAQVKSRSLVQEALASLQIEGNSLTLEEAFTLARELPPRELRNAEREFCNYLRAFDAIDGLRGVREATLSKGDLRNLHRLLVDGVRGGRRGAGSSAARRKVGDVAMDLVPPPSADLAELQRASTISA
jgi:Fic family protein